jgi:hypothetical protein
VSSFDLRTTLRSGSVDLAWPSAPPGQAAQASGLAGNRSRAPAPSPLVISTPLAGTRPPGGLFMRAVAVAAKRAVVMATPMRRAAAATAERAAVAACVVTATV